MSVVLPAFSTDAESDAYIGAAKAVEELGFNALYCGDHLFGNVPTPDALALLASFATVTSRIRLGTAVLLAPLREPIVMAKQIATIDRLSNGRLTIGVGVGGEVEAEWTAMGIPKLKRGARTDEYLELMKQLWSGAEVNFSGEFKGLSGVIGTPLPKQSGGPKIWIGGRTNAALERSLRNDGWCAYAISPQRLAEKVAWLRQRRPDFEVTVLVFSRIEDVAELANRTSLEIVDRYYHQDWTELLNHVGAVGTEETVTQRITEFFEAGADEVIIAPMVSNATDLHVQLSKLSEALLVR